jgi:hypothetical protein
VEAAVLDFAGDLTAAGQFIALLGGLGGIASFVQLIYTMIKDHRAGKALREEGDGNSDDNYIGQTKTLSNKHDFVIGLKTPLIRKHPKVIAAIIGSLLFLLIGGLFIVGGSNLTRQVDISFTIIPPSGSGGSEVTVPIAGEVHGLHNTSDYRVVIYAFTNQWYIQPDTSQKFTYIGPTGDWINQTHLGRRYAILVVKKTFTDLPNESIGLPAIGDNVIATNSINGK